MRQPYEVLVFPFKKEEGRYIFAIFHRRRLKVWQGIAGGGEEGETILETAKRESNEEANISPNSEYLKLDSMCTIPVKFVTGEYTWGKDVYTVTEYAFGVDATGQDIKLSDEHNEFKWVTYEEAIEYLKWDSNRNALWELNERLSKK